MVHAAEEPAGFHSSLLCLMTRAYLVSLVSFSWQYATCVHASLLVAPAHRTWRCPGPGLATVALAVMLGVTRCSLCLPLQEDKIPATPTASESQALSSSGPGTPAPTDGGSMPRSVSSLHKRRHTLDHASSISPNSSGKELLSPDSSKKTNHGFTGVSSA